MDNAPSGRPGGRAGRLNAGLPAARPPPPPVGARGMMRVSRREGASAFGRPRPAGLCYRDRAEFRPPVLVRRADCYYWNDVSLLILVSVSVSIVLQRSQKSSVVRPRQSRPSPLRLALRKGDVPTKVDIRASRLQRRPLTGLPDAAEPPRGSCPARSSLRPILSDSVLPTAIL